MPLFQLLALAIGKTSPILLASLGGMLSELAGVINFALEGMMLAGAFGAVWTTYATGSPWLGLLGGATAGMCIGLLHGLACLVFRANQIVSSIALNLFSAGLTVTLLHQVFQVYGTSPSVGRIPTLNDLQVEQVPVFGEWISASAGGLSIAAPLAILFALILIGFFRWSAYGLRIRACGENPTAARAAGLSVERTRFLSVATGGALAGMGGAYLAIGELSSFVEHMTQGRGYLAIAALILGRWKPSGVLAATLLFGLSEAASEWLSVQWTSFPSQLFLVFPYVVCLAVLVLQIGETRAPSSLGRL
jgi:general nucleoside transport system permease protein